GTVASGGSGRPVVRPRFSTYNSMPRSTASREHAELITPVPPRNSTRKPDMVPTLGRAPDTRAERGSATAQARHGTTVNGRIISLSSCSTMWQWWTYFCGALTPLGRSNLARMVVKYPGLALTVSLKPRSSGVGGSIGPVANGAGLMPPGTPFGVPYLF